MIVLYWMTLEAMTVREQTTLLELLEMAREKNVRRIPVVRGEDELCGIIARTDVYRVVGFRIPDGPMSAETRELLSAHTVGQHMITDVFTCDAYDQIEEVSRQFVSSKVGAMPVMNRGHLVGIISETDLHRALSELAHEGAGGRRITITLPNDTQDVLYSIVDLCRRFHLELLTILTHKVLNDSKHMATLRVRGEHIDRFVKAVWDNGFQVVDVTE